MRGWTLDLTHALRQFRRAPGFTFLATLCLGLGIGVNASMFSLLNFLYFRPLPVEQPDRLVVLNRGGNPLIAYNEFREYQDRSKTLAGIAASNPTESSLDFDGVAHSAAAEAVSINYADVIGVRPHLGRWFQSDDEQSVVLSYRIWQRLFHGAPSVLGKRVRSESQWYTVAGVAPQEFEGIYLPMSMDLWVPIKTWAKQHSNTPRVFVFGRLRAGHEPAEAGAEINSIAEQIQKESPKLETKPARIVVERARGVPNALTRRVAAPIATVLMAVVAIVLFIACVNVGNLLLARSAARAREISVRLALGAGRIRLLRQLLTESVLLAISGGLAGVVLGVWTNRLLASMLASAPSETLLHLDLVTDVRVLSFIAALSFAAVFCFGLAPAWRASHPDIITNLKGEAPSSARFGLRKVSLVAQVSLSLVLLLTAGLFLRMLLRFQSADPGFAFRDRLYVTALATVPEFTPETARGFYAQTLERLRSLPGVRSAAMTNILPLTPMSPGCSSLPGKDPIATTSNVVGPGYLNTMEIPLLSGRDFSSAADPLDGPPSAIVNDTLAKRMWSGQSPIGKRLLFGCHNPTTLEVVGVARDSKFVSVGEPAKPHVYRALSQNTTDGLWTIIVETAPDPGNLTPKIRAEILATNPAVRIYEVKQLSIWVGQSLWQVRWEASVLGAFAWLALVLAAVGLYGVVAYQVSLRTREIGIRLAIGARRGDVFGLVLRQGLRLTLIGLAIGLVLSAGLARLMSKLLYGINPTDVPTYAAVSLLWILVSLAACYLPARRAARVDPMIALRYE